MDDRALPSNHHRTVWCFERSSGRVLCSFGFFFHVWVRVTLDSSRGASRIRLAGGRPRGEPYNTELLRSLCAAREVRAAPVPHSYPSRATLAPVSYHSRPCVHSRTAFAPLRAVLFAGANVTVDAFACVPAHSMS